MPEMTRRDFLKTSLVLAGALSLTPSQLFGFSESSTALPPVVWLQGQGCSGCSISFLNTVTYATAENLLKNSFELKYHPTMMGASGNMAADSAKSAQRTGGYILIVEGAIPTDTGGDYCHVWENMTLLDAIKLLAPRAKHILAIGTCGAYGGISAGTPNPTRAKGTRAALQYLGLPTDLLIDLPGCPVHPDHLVGTVNKLLRGERVQLTPEGRPSEYHPFSLCRRCPNRRSGRAARLGEPGCKNSLGCKGPRTHSDCPDRQWNAGAYMGKGVNWCIGAGSLCIGCTEQGFPDSMSPFFPGRRLLLADSENQNEDMVSGKFELSQNYPNPFNSTTLIQYQLAKHCQVELKIYNILGQKITTLVRQTQKPGHYKIHWNGKDAFGNFAASGTYIYRLKAGPFTRAKQMLLLK